MGDTIAICMATHNPGPELFAGQVESIREQNHGDWICLISDDASDPSRYEEILTAVSGDSRFTVSRSGERLGFYRNFERALGMVPEGVPLVALSDQDDRWFPDKLAALKDGLGGAMLVYSDQQIVREDGEVLSGTYWTDRRNNYRNLLSLLLANTVTGAASLFRAELLEYALPFPEVAGEQYHDHWLALVAAVSGGIEYVDRPLYAYVQHDSALLGHDAANAGNQSLGIRRIDPRRWREIFGRWGTSYFDVHLRLKALAMLLIARCGEIMSGSDRRTLERYVRADRTVSGPLWMALRPLRAIFGKNETLGVERILARAFIYRDAMALRSRLKHRSGGRFKPEGSGAGSRSDPVTESNRMKQKIQPLGISLEKESPPRINLLIPTIDLRHLFGGYIAKFNIARRLSESGHRVRIVTIDPTPPPPREWQAQVEKFAGLDGLLDQVEVTFGREEGLLGISPDDRFIATTWWSALVAAEAVRHTRAERFLYMIQEYEPLTVPQGSWSALALSSYDPPHRALFSTELLAEYFEANSLGVFAEGAAPGREGSTSFRNAITKAEPPSLETIASRKSRKLLFYARPEDHAARNLFELGLLALRGAVEGGVFGPEWEFHGIGSVGRGKSVVLGGGRELTLLPRTDQAAYGAMLGEHDLGLALMYAPHPSLVPLEMASAGLPTVTNSYLTKTAARMSEISSNLIVAEPGLAEITAGLVRGVEAAEDAESRVRGAGFSWPTDWDEAFGPEVISRVSALLREC